MLNGSTFTPFVPGQLVFYRPAPTILKHQPANTEHPLRAGVFLDYYTGPSERFTGQYSVADLEDFVHKHLHSKVGKEHFNLSLHRTEVCRDPAGATEPVFPLKKSTWPVTTKSRDSS